MYFRKFFCIKYHLGYYFTMFNNIEMQDTKNANECINWID